MQPDPLGVASAEVGEVTGSAGAVAVAAGAQRSQIGLIYCSNQSNSREADSTTM